MAWTVLGILWWMAAGAAIALACLALRGRRLREASPFGAWLDRECKVDGIPMRVVAVSHRGAVAVRYIDDESGMHATWVPREEVPERVIWGAVCDGRVEA